MNETVTISLDHYNELRDFKIKIEAGNTYHFCSSPFFKDGFIGTAKAIRNAFDEIESLKIENQRLTIANDCFEAVVSKKVKELSILKFIKLKLNL